MSLTRASALASDRPGLEKSGVSRWEKRASGGLSRTLPNGAVLTDTTTWTKQQAVLNAKLRGHYQYYGRSTNYRSLWKFYRAVQWTWKKWLERRTRGQPLRWEKYAQILRRHSLLRPRITRPWARAVSQT